MNEYVIIDTSIEGYDKLILCLSPENLLAYIAKIENALARSHISGRILFDQLLLTGNSTNRFMSCDFSEGKLDFGTTHIVKPTDYIRQETVKWLHNNFNYVQNSILTEEQRQKVKHNIIF